MFIHDIIKINYVNEGYLPNYPYHMITDREMFDAFLEPDGYFEVNYPCVNDELLNEYGSLLDEIRSRIDSFLTDGTELPKWVYSYMLGHTTSINSDMRDIQDLYDLSGVTQDNVVAVFNAELSAKCYEISCEWIKKQTGTDSARVATMFGEPHVLKSLRLAHADILATP